MGSLLRTFLSARLRMWLLVAVAAPLTGWLLGKLGDLVEARRGPNAVSRVLHTGRRWLRRRSTGPLAPGDDERAADGHHADDRAAADPTGARDAGVPAR